MKKSYGLVAVLVTFMAMLVLAPAANAGNPNVDCQNGQTITDTSGKFHVHVGAGVTCTLDGASVFSVDSRDAANVYVYDTTVKHNIMVSGTTGNTVIGTHGCRYDPAAGNNIKVRDSHNVLICFEHADNNISVTRSDGRITVRDSVADGANIQVNGNLPYVSDGPVAHKHPGYIRIINNTAKEHIFALHNSRRVAARGNHPGVVVK